MPIQLADVSPRKYPKELKEVPITKSTHGKEFFYKYMSASTAGVVLRDQTLRWSAPTEFNDPFDVPRELAVNLSPSDITSAVLKRYIDLIKYPPDDLSSLNPKMHFIVKAAKEISSRKLTEELIIGLRQRMEEKGPNSNSLEAFRNHWLRSVNEMRILCLCESHEKTSMWYHYADKYKGAVIQFACNDSADSPWRIARPIYYTNDEPIVSTADGWAKLLMMPIDEALENILDLCIYSKSEDWEYEKEWRMGSFKRPNDIGPFTDYKFNSNSIGNLYLGPLIEPDNKAMLIEASNKYSNMQVYASSIGVSRKLNFIATKG
jgi:hypothetical protein